MSEADKLPEEAENDKKSYLKKWRQENKEHILKYHKMWRHKTNYTRSYYKQNFKGRSLPLNPKYKEINSTLVGEHYGNWEVIAEFLEDSNKRRYFLVRCACGKEKIVQKHSVIIGKSTSCGCLRKKEVNNE